MSDEPVKPTGLGDLVKRILDGGGVTRCKAFVLASRMLGMGKNSTCPERIKTLNRDFPLASAPRRVKVRRPLIRTNSAPEKQ